MKGSYDEETGEYVKPGENKERHRYQSKHWVIPLEMVEEYEDLHTISSEEFLLLARIESLVRFGNGGCFASNQWLAERQGCQARHLQKMLLSLEERGYLRRWSDAKGRRHLKTKWSRTGRRRTKA